MALSASPPPPVHTIPIDQRPKGYGSLFSKIFFPIIFNLGLIALGSAQFLFLPLLLIPFVGRRLFRRAIDWTKDGFGRLRACPPSVARLLSAMRCGGVRLPPLPSFH